jgi:3-methyladenine DNA glycosylase AlkC
MQQAKNKNALKHKFSKNHLKRTGEAIQDIFPSFNQKAYLATFRTLEPLTMKERVHVLRNELHNLLPKSYPKALSILLKASQSEKMEDFDLWPVTEFIQTYGLNDLDLSLDALKEITKNFTSEWAIRPFIKKYQNETLLFLFQCAKDTDTRVRRWASEGTRPRLPWGEQLQNFIKDPSPTIMILEQLKFDDELFVRKSVANHLNDISKDHPSITIQLLSKWQKEATPKDQKNIDWIVRQAMRTLIKNGHPGALSLLGVAKSAKINVAKINLKTNKLCMGEKLEFSFTVHSLARIEQKLIIDYRVHFVRAHGKTTIKVFKLKNIMIKVGEKLEVKKNHHFKEITTREYYNGVHKLDIQINGIVIKSTKFDLIGASSTIE